jgi:hypothetical protein
MAQALHVETKLLVQREMVILEFAPSVYLEVFGNVQLLHCRPKCSPRAFATR